VYQRTWPQRAAWNTAYERAEYIQQTTGQQQKMVLGEKVGFLHHGNDRAEAVVFAENDEMGDPSEETSSDTT
jgi:hypothetical protein